MFQTPTDRLTPDVYWYTITQNQRELRRYRLTSPLFLATIDALPAGFREFLHALTKDIYDNFWDLDREVENTIDGYDNLSVRHIYSYCFMKMDVSWEGLPMEFTEFVFDHL